MKKEEIAIVAQLLTAMKDSVGKLEDAKRADDMEKFESAKREILKIQKGIEEAI